MQNTTGLRAIPGYTHYEKLADATAWYNDAVSFHDAAIASHPAHEPASDEFRVFAFNAAISLELVTKGILVAENKVIPKTRKLRRLAEAAAITSDAGQLLTIDLLHDVIIWFGKYPGPGTRKEWGEFQAAILRHHKVRLQPGIGATKRADERSFPSKANYMRLWQACMATYRRATAAG